MKSQITTLVDSMKDDIVRFLRDIIAIPSMNGDEEAVVLRVKQEMEKLGYDEVRIDAFGNAVGRIGSGERLLVFDGHCDTVGVGNLENWEVDPFSGEYRDGYIFGRGSTDQKGGVASAVYAGKVIKEIGIPEGMSVMVYASVLEEDQEGVTWQYIINEDNIKPKAVMLTEPTELGIRIGQRGRIEMKVSTRGISCHGSAPERGENAVYKMAPIISDIERLNSSLKDNKELGKGTITISDIRSTAPSLCAVADSATIHLDRRLTAGETLESAVSEVTNLPSVQQAGAEVTVPDYDVKSYTGIVYPVQAYFPMWLMEWEHPVVQTAVRAYQAQLGQERNIGTWVFSTNGVATKGLFDIPTIGLGPGEEKYAHAPNERVRVDELFKAAEFYAAFVLEWGC